MSLKQTTTTRSDRLNTTHQLPADGTGSRLLDEIETAIRPYVGLSSDYLKKVVLWIAATHAATCWSLAPRLVVRAPERRNATTFVIPVIDALCHKPVAVGNASSFAVCRFVDASQDDPPTLIIDHTNQVFRPNQDNHEDLYGLLAAGYRRGRPALRWDAVTRQVETLETFAMAALVTSQELPASIEDHAVKVSMPGRGSGEPVKRYRAKQYRQQLIGLQQQLHGWVRAHAELRNLKQPDGVPGVWGPLLAIADAARGSWPDHARSAATSARNC